MDFSNSGIHLEGNTNILNISRNGMCLIETRSSNHGITDVTHKLRKATKLQGLRMSATAQQNKNTVKSANGITVLYTVNTHRIKVPFALVKSHLAEQCDNGT
jgi:hypothetical protein